MDIHEFKFVNGGKSLFMFTHKEMRLRLDDESAENNGTLFDNPGIQEVDLATRKILFEWWALDNDSIQSTESYIYDG